MAPARRATRAIRHSLLLARPYFERTRSCADSWIRRTIHRFLRGVVDSLEEPFIDSAGISLSKTARQLRAFDSGEPCQGALQLSRNPWTFEYSAKLLCGDRIRRDRFSLLRQQSNHQFRYRGRLPEVSFSVPMCGEVIRGR